MRSGDRPGLQQALKFEIEAHWTLLIVIVGSDLQVWFFFDGIVAGHIKSELVWETGTRAMKE